MSRLAWAVRAVQSCEPAPLLGQVSAVVGLMLRSRGPRASVGELCRLRPPGAPPGEGLLAEVVGFSDGELVLLPLDEPRGLGPGWEVQALGEPLTAPVGEGLLGRVLDGLGRPLDGRGPLAAAGRRPVLGNAPPPLGRRPIREPLATGVRAIDGLLTCGKGQRLGIFAGSGVGKSTLLGMVARGTAADVGVIALIGERGREVAEFIAEDLGPEGLARSVVVVATADAPALVRLKGALVAMAIAEQFRDEGRDVLLLMDSVTRLALAQREVGLAAGEPPATRGYPPSVFALLPRLLERAGSGERGSITGLFTVLVDGDDMNEPIADTARGILDGHVVLSRRLAALGHYPAIDVLQSVSRVMPRVTSPEQRRAAVQLRRILATYQEAEDLISVGAYQGGTSPEIDAAIAARPAALAYLQQGAAALAAPGEAADGLVRRFGNAG